MAVVDSTIQVPNAENIDAIIKERLINGFKYIDVDLPADWKNNTTTIVLRATQFPIIENVLEEIKILISATTLNSIYSNQEEVYYYIRFKF